MPDGSGIVFTAAAQRTPASEFGSDLWFQPLPDGRPRQITTGLVQYRNVTITTDGSSLVSVGNLQNAGLWRLPLDGGRLEHIPSQREDGLVGLGWLDANTIAFTSFDGGTSQIWTMDLEGANRRQITTDGWNYLPRASRNGQTIFFAATRDGRPGLWRMDRTGAAQRRIVETHGATDLSLTADERSVLFTAPGGDRLDSTWTVSVDGGRPTLLVKGLSRAAASPDGASLAGFWQQGPNARIMLAVFPAGGGEPSAVFDVGAPAANGGVWWSRDGRVLYYTGSDRVNVWRQPLAGGAPAVVTDLADSMISRGDLSPDGRTLLAVRANPRRDAFLIRGFR
jgi:Tol biopolymer transport system component